jgi:hypothetical protein
MRLGQLQLHITTGFVMIYDYIFLQQYSTRFIYSNDARFLKILWHRFDPECYASALCLPFECVDGVAATTMAWLGSGRVTEEAGEAPCTDCTDCTESGPFSSRMARAAKAIEPEAGCDLWEGSVGGRKQ